ncbi:MAG TPA: hypothetical protein VLH17_10280, partial [Candidatus Binatia bacterium]|nr:hypothetical protein [Candidatus Binatia bacterium]
VVLEAFASGLPVITVAGVGAFDKVEGDLRFGILENPEDTTELKTKLSFFFGPCAMEFAFARSPQGR